MLGQGKSRPFCALSGRPLPLVSHVCFPWQACHTAEVPYIFQAMEIIRSNYSTLGPYARSEAPEPTEYPFTRKMDVYRQMVERLHHENVEVSDLLKSEVSGENYNHSTGTNTVGTVDESHKGNTAFQRVLELVFGDYFHEDADDAIASDMADRWVAFAQKGDPNYENSRAKWHPWRHVTNDDILRMNSKDEEGGWRDEELDLFDLDVDAEALLQEDGNASLVEMTVWSDDPFERAYRRRALKALGLEVVEEDVFQTVLKRQKKEPSEPENPFNSFLFGSGHKGREESRRSEDVELSRRAIRQLQQIAQDMGVLGTGLHGEPAHRRTTDWEEDFFPEILELKWPPEDRLVERDCTCDMWDRIRYRY
jgi:Carboxylesterase family